MMMVDTEIKRSPISGYGLFAVTEIPKGTLIWQHDDRIDVTVKDKDLTNLPQSIQTHIAIYGFPHMTKAGLHCFEVDGGRYMNHSDSPNTSFKDPLVAHTTRSIKAGEEITCNYAEFIPGFAGFGSNAA